MSQAEIRACRECGQDYEYHDLGIFGPSGWCPACYTAWYRVNHKAEHQEQPEPRCGYCAHPFGTWDEAWAHESTAHHTEQRINAGAWEKPVEM